MTKENNSIKLKAVKELMEESFFIPAYQRGYRWEEKQVKTLLEDINTFSKKEDRQNDEFYCLQPLIVKKNNDRWEVIDGQQRLTTIFLILKHLDKDPPYSITYETRDNSESFLNKIEETNNTPEENIDFYHIHQAYQTIDSFFKDSEVNHEEFEKALKYSTKVIWYQEQSNSSEKAFRNFNSGKIALTKAELIRGALALGFSEKEDTDSRALNNKISFAVEWHDMEQLLANDQFWHFLYHKDTPKEKRMNIFIEAALKAEKSTEEKDELEDYRDHAPERWAALKRRFEQWREFYEDRMLYHLTGFLVLINKRAYGSEVFNYYDEISDKASLLKKVQREVKSKLAIEVDDSYEDKKEKLRKLNYHDNSKQLKRILLLHNILSYQGRKDEYRFPFQQYKKHRWQIEHIQACASNILDVIENNINDEKIPAEEKKKKTHITLSMLDKIIRQPIESNPETPTLKDIKERIKAAISKHNEGKFKFSDDLRNLTKQSEDLKLHSTWNLALLDGPTNSSIGKKPFGEKRQEILQIMANPSSEKLILLCIEKVFTKSYSNGSENLSFWEEKDRKAYLEDIFNTVADYITIEKEQ